jgi:hypothetical protein
MSSIAQLSSRISELETRQWEDMQHLTGVIMDLRMGLVEHMIYMGWDTQEGGQQTQAANSADPEDPAGSGKTAQDLDEVEPFVSCPGIDMAGQEVGPLILLMVMRGVVAEGRNLIALMVMVVLMWILMVWG